MARSERKDSEICQPTTMRENALVYRHEAGLD